MAAEDDPQDLRKAQAVLRGLQRIGDHLPQVEAASKNPGDTSETQAPSRAGIGSGDAESLVDKRPGQGRHLAALALAMLAAGTVIVLAGDLFLKYWPSSPSSRPAAEVSGGVTSAVVTTER